MSSSSLLIFLGLYQPMTKGIADLSPLVILPLLAGLVISVAVSARAVRGLFEKHYSAAYHTIIGFVIASTIVIIPLKYEGLTEILLSLGCFAAGLVIALLMDRMAEKERGGGTDQ
jgi:putative membrane protein